MENEKLKAMENEVKEIHNKIIMACEDTPKLKEIYKGCIIYLSPCYQNPDILFFGINPGDGHYREHGEIIQEFEPQEKDKHSGYGMWKEFEDCCSKINKKYLLKNMVKTNRYFFATHNVSELHKFFDLLPQEFRNEVLRKQEDWTRTLINELSPKLIIAGGKSIWERFNKLYSEPKTLEESKYVKVLQINNIPLIAYQRSFNKMTDKKVFLAYLDKYTNTFEIKENN